MKKVLITGKNSYVGNSLEKWLNNYPGEYEINKISVRDDSWKTHNFSPYDAILHVAGIAHQKETKENKELYFKVNRDLSFEISKKAKKEGVKHFIFLSSMSVYGLDNGTISKDTVPKPQKNYGKSKLEAELLINSISNDKFKCSIIRPPMIYGKGCKGNYKKLSKLVEKSPFFPDINNNRSMIHIDNLSELIKILIDNQMAGVFLPQNKEYVSTSEMVRQIARAKNKNIKLVKWMNPLIKLSKNKIPIINKLFGNLTYKNDKCNLFYEYHVRDFNESIYISETQARSENK
ncbi:UDP-glucose 4-epimerase [Gracilibacillus halotolerans]|uniref:UDP-glucose 4-epimerase n=1 Tax=Gracilibacillus halotolerans TaxID=74386 RepID=A0A841RLV6_9BACI|nr:NAD-dependent epimerase/dehydratase family protein [Gracilibacillus halotolerans]MBB6512867.1 UDP-glucose 4-epimerase [Gracilibacillus halotolerans]